MKNKTLISILTASTLYSSSALAGGIFGGGGSWWPDLPDIGISIPSVGEWKIGGSIGKLWEENKAAIAMATVGGTLLGPIGLVYGLLEGHKTDQQRVSILKLKARMEQEGQDYANAVKEASTRWPAQAEKIGLDFVDASNYLAEVQASVEATDELEQSYFNATVCLINAQDRQEADRCKFDFSKEALDVQERN